MLGATLASRWIDADWTSICNPFFVAAESVFRISPLIIDYWKNHCSLLAIIPFTAFWCLVLVSPYFLWILPLLCWYQTPKASCTLDNSLVKAVILHNLISEAFETQSEAFETQISYQPQLQTLKPNQFQNATQIFKNKCQVVWPDESLQHFRPSLRLSK